MNKEFVKEMLTLVGQELDCFAHREIEGYSLFQIRVGSKLICIEVAKPEYTGGRLFIMDEGTIDGEGEFPL